MRVVNVMLGGKRGGIEQAAVDYAKALRFQGHDVVTVIRKGAWVESVLAEAGLPAIAVALPYEWNPFARRRMKDLIAGADVAILHGNRAADVTTGIRGVPLVPVVHSRFFKHRAHFAALITASQAMADRHGPAVSCPVHFVPNLIHMPDDAARPAFRAPPVIGAMGRLSAEKGMDIFINAIAILRARGVIVEAVIGGGGDQEEALKRQAAAPALAGAVTFRGWVGDKAAFFRDIDIFCLSSRTETFPITVLEAMSHGCSVVATRCGGPSEMIDDGITGFLADVDATDLADTLQNALQQPETAMRAGAAGRAHVRDTYDLPVVARKLDAVLSGIAHVKK
jgi:glycosyltransferase involved in cell wall biosynthesis